MTLKLLRYITFMCLCVVLGAFNLIIAPFTSKLWIFILDEVAAIMCFFMAYICYRRARKIAEAIDGPTEIEIRIERLTPDAPLPALKETEEHEDIGHPV